MQQTKGAVEVGFFYGPSDKFGDAYNLQSVGSYITLLQLASNLDAARLLPNKEFLNFEEDTLIVWPEEFFGVRDNFTNSLWRNVLETNLQKVYVANPPELLVKQAKLLFGPESVTECSHSYKSISLDLIKEVSSSLESIIVGQDEAVQFLPRCLVPLMKSKMKPVVVMLYGPTGVGKTESAKIIAKALGGEASRIQFSMLQTGSLAEYLYGSSVNSRSFAADLLERQSNVVIFDEFDKTGSAFHSAFYQLFDEGLFVDKNYSVDMSNTLIVCTSNYSSPQEIRQHLGESLSSRFSAFIKYAPLDQAAKTTIIKQKINEIYESYPEGIRQSIDKNEIEQRFISTLYKSSNVREITAYIEQIISSSILASVEEKSDNGNTSLPETAEPI